MEIVNEVVCAHDIIGYAYTPTLYSEDVLFWGVFGGLARDLSDFIHPSSNPLRHLFMFTCFNHTSKQQCTILCMGGDVLTTVHVQSWYLLIVLLSGSVNVTKNLAYVNTLWG